MESHELYEQHEQPESVVPAKDLFRIGEVSRIASTKPFVLRYWETEFPMLQPVKSPKGHRLYRRKDVDMVLVIKRLLYDEGFTIAGARRHLRDHAGTSNGGNGSGNGGMETSKDAAERDSSEHAAQSSSGNFSERSPQHSPQGVPPSGFAMDRKLLLDLRDSLRSLLTVLESE